MKLVNKGPQIKYDKLEQKVGLVIGLICTIGVIVTGFMLELEVLDRLNTMLAASIVLGGIYFCPVMAIVGWRLFFSSWGYMKRLEKYGYKAPERKKLYHGRQDLLERFEVSLPNVNKWHSESVILACVSWVAGVCCLPYPFYVWQSYPDMDIILIIMMFPVVCWAVMGFYYWRQRDQLKYKDDVELDDKRKTRQNLADGLVTIFVCAALSVLYSDIIYNWAKVIYKARLEAGWY